MNVASLSFCKELYGLSGWCDTTAYYKANGGITINYRNAQPAYDLGYLLRKLQELEPEVSYFKTSGWNAVPKPNKTAYNYFADTPEDAACKLAIELFKKGVLERQQ